MIQTRLKWEFDLNWILNVVGSAFWALKTQTILRQHLPSNVFPTRTPTRPAYIWGGLLGKPIWLDDQWVTHVIVPMRSLWGRGVGGWKTVSEIVRSNACIFHAGSTAAQPENFSCGAVSLPDAIRRLLRERNLGFDRLY